MISKQRHSGYIAFISVIIISISLLTTVIAVSMSGFFSRFNILESEQKAVSFYLAKSCINTAFINFTQDTNYTAGLTNIKVGEHYCEIISVTTGSAPSSRLITVQGKFNSAYTNLEVEIGPAPNYQILKWRELPYLTN
jgi:hypothetical protein